LLLGYKPVQHVTVLNTVGNCNTMVSIIMLYYNNLWDGLLSRYNDYVLTRSGIESRW